MNKEKEELLISWLTLIGSITLFWSPIERSIDQIVSILYKSQNKSDKKTKPLSLNRKLGYIKSKIQSNVISKDKLESLIKQTKKTVQIRDVCVHGVLHEFDEYAIKISKVQGKDKEHLIEVFTIDRARFDKSADKMSILTEKWSKLVNKVVAN